MNWRIVYWPRPTYFGGSDVGWVYHVPTDTKWSVWFRIGPFLVLYLNPDAGP